MTGAQPSRRVAGPEVSSETPPLLDVRGLNVTFTSRRRSVFRPPARIRAVVDVNLEVQAGETLGLVGESGSGKSSTGKAILGLVKPDSGTVRFRGDDLLAHRRVPRDQRRRIQAVFQDPYSSLNPSMLVGAIISEPLRHRRDMSTRTRAVRVAELLDAVGLEPRHARRFPHEFSGGQRQRIAIARALAPDPQLLVLDEPVSALDVSTQAQIINVLERLQRDLGIAYLLIAHDLSVVRHASHRIAVMYQGRIVEAGLAEQVWSAPAHPYTKALVAAVPVAEPERQRERRRLRAELKPPTTPAPHTPEREGCPYAARCVQVHDRCREEMPGDEPAPHGGTAQCHLYGPETH